MTIEITDEQVTDALVEVRQLLTPDGTWMQDGYAGDGSDYTCVPTSIMATCWCLDGAMLRVTQCDRKSTDNPWRATLLARMTAAVAAWLHPADGSRAAAVIHDWNDAAGRTQEQVLASLDALIAKRRAVHV